MFKFASLAVLALALGVRADLSVSTPDSVTQCQPVTFQITGSSTGPYWAYVVNSNDACGDAIAEIDNISGTSFTWTANATANASLMIAIEAQDNSEGWSGAFTVAAGDASCLTSASPSSSSSHTTSTTHSTAHGTTLTAPANAVSNTANTADDSSPTSGASSRAVVGVSSMVALLGAVMAFSL